MNKAKRNLFLAKPMLGAPSSLGHAPAPTKGNALIIYRYLHQYGPLTTKALEESCIALVSIVPHKLDKATTVRQSIYNMVYKGIIDAAPGPPGIDILSIATKRDYKLRQEQLTGLWVQTAARKVAARRDAKIAAEFARYNVLMAKQEHRAKITGAVAIIAITLACLLNYVAYTN
jgi:hypothetical protein